MTVARMLRVTVLGHDSAVEPTVDVLQRAGMLEISAQEQDLPSAGVALDDEARRRLEELSADTAFVREFLGRYHSSTAPFSSFVSEKFHVDTEEFLSMEAGAPFMRLYRECVDIADRLASGERERSRLRTLARELEPWEGLRLEIRDWLGTEHVALFAGTVPSSQGEKIRAQLRAAVKDVSVDQLGAVGTRQAWVVMAHRDSVAQVRAVLALTPFVEVSFPGLTGYPAEERAKALARIDDLALEATTLAQRAQTLSVEHFETSVALDEVLDSRLAAILVRDEFGSTDRAFLISGWVRESQRDALVAALAPMEERLDLTFSEPLEEDTPPVELNNPWFLRPFEVLTDLYGRPGHHEVDPTPLLAPFFLTFFALCIGDVGYGAMLVGGSLLIKNKLDVAPGVRRFMDLLIAGGIAAMVVGVLFGSYFAIDFAALPSFLQFRVLDPLGNLQGFLVLTIILGVTQVFFGVFVAAWDAWRRGDAAGAISEQLSTIFMFAMFAYAAFAGAMWAIPVALVVTMLLQGRALERALSADDRPPGDRALGTLWVAMALAWAFALAFGGPAWSTWAFLGITIVFAVVSRSARSAVLGLLGGLYAVYGMSSFLGDVLSYTRLAALGLSGSLVGYVFNLLTSMVWSGASGLFQGGGFGWVGGILVIVGAVAIFVVGHTFNVVINLLGAFVHPARLQFVEFFSKFYEGGGRPFAPFTYSTKSLVLHAGPARQEGGAGS